MDLLETLGHSVLVGWSRGELKDLRRGLAWASALPAAACVCVGLCVVLAGVPGHLFDGGMIGLALAAVLTGGVLGSLCGWSTLLRASGSGRYKPGRWRGACVVAGYVTLAGMPATVVGSFAASVNPAWGALALACFVAFCLAASAHLAIGMMGLSRLGRAMNRRGWSLGARAIAAGCFVPPLALVGVWISLGAMLASFASFDDNPPPPTDMERLVWGIGRTLACTAVPLSLGVLAAWVGLVSDMRGTMGRATEGDGVAAP